MSRKAFGKTGRVLLEYDVRFLASKESWIQDASVSILSGLLANPKIIDHNHATGWALVNCTPAQIADYARHMAEQLWSVNEQQTKGEG